MVRSERALASLALTLWATGGGAAELTFEVLDDRCNPPVNTVATMEGRTD